MKKNCLLLSLLISIPAFLGAIEPQTVFKNFVQVSGDRLLDGENELRFISFNVPNLHCIEDYMRFEEPNPWWWPESFEIRDALETVKHMGGEVVRIYTITVRRQDDAPQIPRHVLGPGRFNEEGFRAMDQLLAIANEVGVRVIIPLVDNWKWMGGRGEYAAFRGKAADAFYTDPQIVADFKKTIQFITQRVNTITGVRYCDDKAILAWETGNELGSCPMEWIQEIIAYIKKLDPNHLVMDGSAANILRDETIANPLADIVTTHHYEGDPRQMMEHIKISAEKAKGKKPYLVGEFGFISTSGVAAVLDLVQQNPTICGALIWSLRFHARDGGFYWHSEPGAGRYFYKAYHVPGFDSGETIDERNLISCLRRYAFAIRHLTEPPMPVPQPPHLLPCEDVAQLTWQGSAFAAAYDLERAPSADGPWQVIAADLSDANTAHRPLYNDLNAELGRPYYYRVRAKNISGVSAPSNIIGPILKKHHTLVDEFFNYGIIFSRNDEVSIQNENARYFKEDSHRLKGQKNGRIIYYTPSAMNKVIIYFFSDREEAPLDVSISTDGKTFSPLEMKTFNYFSGKGDYDYLRPIKWTANVISNDIHYLKIHFLHETQIGRVEIQYGR